MSPDAQIDLSGAVDRRMASAREWDGLIEQVRALDGFADFLRPPRLEALLPAAAYGPIAIINLSRWRCDALVVGTGGMQVVELPRLTLETVVDRTDSYLVALSNVDHAAHEVHTTWQRYDGGDGTLAAIRRYTEAKLAYQRAVNDRDRTLDAALAWLWDEIANPVLTAIGLVDPPAPGQPWPRLWWCPTGPLTLLPLHAAGYHDGTGRAVVDRVVPSYTPTLRALLEARRPLDPAPDDERMLIVAVPDTPDAVPLTDVMRERDLLTSVFAGRNTLLEGDAANVDAVLTEMPLHRWAHFCCHGGQDLADPSRGGLLLHDRTLSVAEISAQRHNGEFAFLSACMTATGGVALPDEAITLAAALHYTGYRRVIGTLWSVHDDTAADVAATVYADLTATGRFEPERSADALHRAIRELRDVHQLPPSAWTPFTHTGP
ncbi:CHAT domain-containing protein [Streptomyces sp. NPDC091377]|uniref:CHAT domain-containing protein n=1 Tax=Streptomyces sp. NPDC091377 TaxID=3365995 RepID=UPI00380885D5